MATIRQLDSGYWQSIVRKKGYPQKSKTFATHKEADSWAKDVESQMNRGTYNDLSEAESLTIRQGLQKYLEDITPTKKGAYQETNRIKRLLNNSSLCDKTFATLKSFDIAKYRDDMAKQGLSASTINKQLSIFSHLFDVALKDWGVSCVNPVKMISKPKVENSRDRRLSDLEQQYLFRALKVSNAGDRSNHETLKMVIFALETGMRKSEPFQLNWSDIDLKNGVAQLKTTKNGKPRGVPLSPTAIQILKGEVDDEKVLKLRRGKVFTTTYSALTQSFRRAVGRAQRLYFKEIMPEARVEGFLDDFTYHDLRHEATSRLAEVFEMHELMKIIGHSDARMLSRYYHPSVENLAKKLASKQG